MICLTDLADQTVVWPWNMATHASQSQSVIIERVPEFRYKEVVRCGAP